TEGHRIVTEGHRIVTQGHRIVTQGQRIVTQGHRIVTEGHRIVTEGHRNCYSGTDTELLLRNRHRIVTEGHRIVTEGHRIVTQDRHRIGRGGQCLGGNKTWAERGGARGPTIAARGRAPRCHPGVSVPPPNNPAVIVWGWAGRLPFFPRSLCTKPQNGRGVRQTQPFYLGRAPGEQPPLKSRFLKPAPVLWFSPSPSKVSHAVGQPPLYSGERELKRGRSGTGGRLLPLHTGRRKTA
ncbi:unnamed protein product, partial [Staurois parvus]